MGTCVAYDSHVRTAVSAYTTGTRVGPCSASGDIQRLGMLAARRLLHLQMRIHHTSQETDNYKWRLHVLASDPKIKWVTDNA